MKISGIDKDFENIIYYLDDNGFKPFSSCDGVEANHKDPSDVDKAYIAFLKSPKITDLMATFLKNKENFITILKSEDHMKAYELYGNIISGTTYSVNFPNKFSENTDNFENIIRNVLKEKVVIPSEEKRKLDTLEKVLEENSDGDLSFQVNFNENYEPYMNKEQKINSLRIFTKVGKERIEGNISIHTEKDMEALASILSKKYNMSQKKESFEGDYSETEFIMSSFDKTTCTIYFTDEHFFQILEQIKYSRQIAHILPTFEGREWIGSDEELWDEEYNEIEEQQTPLEQREENLIRLEEEENQITRIEQMIKEMSQKNKSRGE